MAALAWPVTWKVPGWPTSAATAPTPPFTERPPLLGSMLTPPAAPEVIVPKVETLRSGDRDRGVCRGRAARSARGNYKGCGAAIGHPCFRLPARYSAISTRLRASSKLGPWPPCPIRIGRAISRAMVSA